ncbi:MAG: hypothetical protein HFJ50_06185 [Clostridia bacterium]|nr:hypothetical protein [Clostridia bacterium]
MNEITGKSIGFIQIEVFETEDNSNIFYLQANNPNVLHILNYLETSLENHKLKKK